MAEKSKVVYGVLAILLGALGIHKFYVGDTKNGIIHLAIFLCLIWVGLGAISSILGIISGIMALLMEDKEFNQKYVVDKKLI
jgi:TM2 domain-containing membrane protein YozV